MEGCQAEYVAGIDHQDLQMSEDTHPESEGMRPISDDECVNQPNVIPIDIT